MTLIKSPKNNYFIVSNFLELHFFGRIFLAELFWQKEQFRNYKTNKNVLVIGSNKASQGLGTIQFFVEQLGYKTITLKQKQ